MKQFVVITSISAPNLVLQTFAEGARISGAGFIVIGDTKSPDGFSLEGCDFYSIERQKRLALAMADLCPVRHYARKNIGYLVARAAGADVIRDTDDDNLPRSAFWNVLPRTQKIPVSKEAGWTNVYRWFSAAPIWPRGLPLDEVNRALPEFDLLPYAESDCPIQQGLADENPDVDAIYRLLFPLPQSFRGDRRVALGQGGWCPFNSQNTTWYRDAFPLLYLPAYCSFRMTDIWRSFVAQRIAWENGWSILFHEATVSQERNWHDLMHDFRDEIPGYLHNATIARELAALPLKGGTAYLGDNMRICYRQLCELKLVGPEEPALLEAWLSAFECD